MKAFLRDLAFLGLFAASIAAIVLVIAVHRGRFSLEAEHAENDGAMRAPAVMTPMPAHAAASPESGFAGRGRTPAPPESPAPDFAPPARSPFDPRTRGVAGDARVLCLPEVTWLQEQLSGWAAEARAAHRPAPATLEAAHAAARRASALEYRVSPECWNDPAVVETRSWGDCADKSLWLARELLRAGYTPVGIRLGVPEGYEPGQPGHAWVVLYHHGGEWIYDPAAGPRLTSQDAGPTKRFRVTATVFPR